MSGYVLYYLTYEPNNSKQKPVINGINIELIDSSLHNIKDVLDEKSSKWIQDEIGKNNYNETLDDARPFNELPDGLIRRYACADSENTSGFNHQMSGNIIKQINVYKKTTSTGSLFGKWIDVELIRSYMIAKGVCQNFHYESTNQPQRVADATVQMPSYDEVIDQLRNFNFNKLRSVANRMQQEQEQEYNEDFKQDFKQDWEDFSAFQEDLENPIIPPLPVHLVEKGCYIDADSSSSEDSSSYDSSSDDSSSASYETIVECEESTEICSDYSYTDSDSESDSGSYEWDDDEPVEEHSYELINEIPIPPPMPEFKLPGFEEDKEDKEKTD